MPQKKIYILLGKYGTISSLLYEALKLKNQTVFAISWNNLKNGNLENNLILRKKLSKIKENKMNFKLIFIDCLIGSYESDKEVKLHKKYLLSSKQLGYKSEFIFLSTFEPQLEKTTSYRLMKFVVEKKLKKYGMHTIRIGKPFKKNNITNNPIKNIFNVKVSDFRLRPLIIPGTYILDLINSINKCSGSKGKVIKCYSTYLNMIIKLSFIPSIKFEKSSSFFTLLIPSRMIIYFSIFICSILKKIKPNNKFIYNLEKIISLISHQNIIYNKNIPNNKLLLY